MGISKTCFSKILCIFSDVFKRTYQYIHTKRINVLKVICVYKYINYKIVKVSCSCIKKLSNIVKGKIFKKYIKTTLSNIAM